MPLGQGTVGKVGYDSVSELTTHVSGCGSFHSAFSVLRWSPPSELRRVCVPVSATECNLYWCFARFSCLWGPNLRDRGAGLTGVGADVNVPSEGTQGNDQTASVQNKETDCAMRLNVQGCGNLYTTNVGRMWYDC